MGGICSRMKDQRFSQISPPLQENVGLCAWSLGEIGRSSSNQAGICAQEAMNHHLANVIAE